MPLELLAESADDALPVFLVAGKRGLDTCGAGPGALRWAGANGFAGKAGELLAIPGSDGALAGAFFGVGEDAGASPLVTGRMGRALPEGTWRFGSAVSDPSLAALSLLLGSYVFTRYGKKQGRALRFVAPQGADIGRVRRWADGVFLARDLINTPANDMGPSSIEAAVRQLATAHGAEVSVTEGDALIEANFPMIHAVGRAGSQAPRLIDMRWGAASAPRVTLVGKGVSFDTGGLDIKPPNSMLLMKKDMGGAANVLGLASMLMESSLNIRLRVLIPAVENAIAGNAFRPGDVLPSRKGLSVEIGNTDAEGRLILADALALADEEAPELLIDMATLTGAARVALGAELPPFYTDDDAFAAAVSAAAMETADPVWRMPLWAPYAEKLSSRIADINNVTTDGLAGSITAALFLKRFVEKAACWAHFDIFGWNPTERPHCPVGGEAQAIRALEAVLVKRFGG